MRSAFDGMRWRYDFLDFAVYVADLPPEKEGITYKKVESS